MRLKILFLFLVLFLFVPSYLHAETSSNTDSTRAAELRKTNTETVRKEAVVRTVTEKKASTEARLLERKATLKQQMEERRKEATEEFKLKREQFQTRMAAIKDEKKQALVEKIDARITSANKNRTDFMASVLERLSAMVTKLTERSDKAKTAGKDVSAVEEAITNAQTAISKAQEAVAAQAGQDYVITIASDNTLKTTVGDAVSNFEEDIRSVHALVVSAKQSVQEIVRELMKLNGEKLSGTPEKVASPSVSLSPTAVPIQ